VNISGKFLNHFPLTVAKGCKYFPVWIHNLKGNLWQNILSHLC
jgi:hypothetical protein